MSSEYDDLAGLLSADETEMWRARAAEFVSLQSQRHWTGGGEDEGSREGLEGVTDSTFSDDPAMASLMGVSFLGLDDTGPSLPASQGGGGEGGVKTLPVSAKTLFSAEALEASMRVAVKGKDATVPPLSAPPAPLSAQALEASMRESVAPPPSSQGVTRAVLMALATNAPVPPPPGWNPSLPPPPGCFVAFMGADGASPSASLPSVSVPVPGSSSHLPAPGQVYPPPPSTTSLPSPPGLLPNPVFLATQGEFTRLLMDSANPASFSDPLEVASRVGRIQDLHRTLSRHVEAMISLGVAARPLPPLPPMLSLEASSFAASSPPTQTLNGRSQASTAGEGGPPSTSKVSMTYAQKAGASSAGSGTLFPRPATGLTEEGSSGASNASPLPSQGAGYVRPPPPPRPATLASLLSGPKPTSFGGKGMSHGDVLSVNRYFFNSLAQYDPFTEAYYLFALQAKAKLAAEVEAKRSSAALAAAIAGQYPSDLPQDKVVASKLASALDAVALLTSAGTAAAAAAGRQRNALARGRTIPSKVPQHLASPPSSSAAKSLESESDTPTPAPSAPLPAPLPDVEAALVDVADAAAALPVGDRNSAAARFIQEDLTRLHAIKRRAWEEHQKVLGRQESMNIRAPKRALNLSSTGFTSAGDIKGRKALVGSHAVSALSEEGEEEEEESMATNGALWATRATIERCLGLVLALQEAARKLLGMLRGSAMSTGHALSSQRFHVSELRRELGESLGLTKASGGEGGEEEDAVLLSIVCLPKGKRLIARAVPMLNPDERAAACTVGLRRLPYFVASDITGKDALDAEVADGLLSSALEDWIKTTQPSSTPTLAMLASWVDVLNKSHTGVKLRALLGHPLASSVISSLLMRGEECAKGVESKLEEDKLAGDKEKVASLTPHSSSELTASLAAWKLATEALGASYLEAV